MVRNDLFITVPSFFKCPISLDVMKSPVSLATGVTYDRSSIQAWLDSGNNTCPATMQVLPSKDFVPNHNLHRLIQIWSDSANKSDLSPSSTQSRRSIQPHQIKELVNKIEMNSAENCVDGLQNIADFAASRDENRKFIADIQGFVPSLVNILSNGNANVQVFEPTIRVLDLVLMEYRDKDQLIRSMVRNRDLLASLVALLKKGNLDSKIASARVLETLAIDPQSIAQIADTEEALIELINLISSAATTEAGLSCLITISACKQVKVKLIRLGLFQTLTKTLSQLEASSSIAIIEKSLKLLEMVSACTEGRKLICSEPNCVTAIVEKMLKVSKVATEHAVVILWSVCYLFRDQVAQEAVMKSNGLTKILLIMQSNCSPSVRQMCSDLMKIFRVSSKSCLSSYDTKTTHITPF